MSKSGWILAASVAAIVAGVAFAFPHLEGSPPTVGAIEVPPIGAGGRSFRVELADPDSGLRRVEVRLLSRGGAKTLLSQGFPGNLLGGAPASRSTTIEMSIDPDELGLPDGSLSLVLVARDWSWRNGFSGNRIERSATLQVDTRPPDLRVESGLTYVRRGGAGIAIYHVSESRTRNGVQVGETFFPGYAPEPGQSRHVALFAVPVEAGREPAAQVLAVDEAGNETRASFRLSLQERRFPTEKISLSEDFLEIRVVRLARELGISAPNARELFRRINEEVRAENERRIRELVVESAPSALWSGAFKQLPGSKVMSRFAERRVYWDGELPVSHARHYGFDLASTAGANVPAANSGVVRFAGPLGIYGNSVLLDHGLGLTSLYAHLSRLDVAAGDRVEAGAVLGLTGETGLAGGDHLHFAILVGDTYVDPMEWWDPRWIRTHIEARLERARP